MADRVWQAAGGAGQGHSRIVVRLGHLLLETRCIGGVEPDCGIPLGESFRQAARRRQRVAKIIVRDAEPGEDRTAS
jgi:hypothetical protein